MDYLRYGVIMLAAGIGIPVLAALNAALGTRIGSPAGAAACLFLVALGGALVALVFLPKPSLDALITAPRHLFLAGLFVTFYVLSVTWVAPYFGIGNAIMFVLLGQLVSAALIDQFGWLGATQTPITLARGTGIALMATGLILTQRG